MQGTVLSHEHIVDEWSEAQASLEEFKARGGEVMVLSDSLSLNQVKQIMDQTDVEIVAATGDEFDTINGRIYTDAVDHQIDPLEELKRRAHLVAEQLKIEAQMALLDNNVSDLLKFRRNIDPQIRAFLQMGPEPNPKQMPQNHCPNPCRRPISGNKIRCYACYKAFIDKNHAALLSEDTE